MAVVSTSLQSLQRPYGVMAQAVSTQVQKRKMEGLWVMTNHHQTNSLLAVLHITDGVLTPPSLVCSSPPYQLKLLNQFLNIKIVRHYKLCSFFHTYFYSEIIKVR